MSQKLQGQEKGQKEGRWTVEQLEKYGWLRGLTIQEGAALCLQEQEKRIKDFWNECEGLPFEAVNKQKIYLDALLRATRESLGKLMQ